MKKIICSILISTLLIQIYGCYSEYLTAKKNLKTEPYDIDVVTKDKSEYSGNKHCWETKNDTLIIYNEQLKPEHEIPFNLIDQIYMNKIDPVKVTLLTATVLIVGAVIYFAITNIRTNFLKGGNFF